MRDDEWVKIPEVSPVDTVTRPAHYHQGDIDVIAFLEQFFPERKFTVAEGFFIGNILKYTCRYREKNGIEDLVKAQDYLERLMDHERRIET
jgi:Protein of unknwon function (DUF3310)